MDDQHWLGLSIVMIILSVLFSLSVVDESKEFHEQKDVDNKERYMRSWYKIVVFIIMAVLLPLFAGWILGDLIDKGYLP